MRSMNPATAGLPVSSAAAPFAAATSDPAASSDRRTQWLMRKVQDPTSLRCECSDIRMPNPAMIVTIDVPP